MKLHRWAARAALGIIAMAGLAGPASAQDATLPEEYGKHIQHRNQIVGGEDLFGDRIDPNSGSLEIVQTDVDLPGNGPGVRVGRRYRPADAYGKGHFNYWDLDIPHLHGVFADIVSPLAGWTGWGDDPKQRCSHFSEPHLLSVQGGWFAPDEYWSGSFFYLPGSGDQELLERSNALVPSDGATYPVVTRDGAAARCVALAPTSEGGSQGEGFEVVTPDGTVYTLNQMVSRIERPLRKANPSPPFAPDGKTDPASAGTEQLGLYYTLGRKKVLLFPTQVKDRFGNVATYVWSPTNPWQLLRIEASDGRHLDFTYQSPASQLVTAVSDGTRTWQYAYAPGGGQSNDPDTVTLPDGSVWTYRLRYLSYATTPTYNVSCDNLNTSVAIDTGTVTSPSGATLTLTVTPTKFGRSWVWRECIPYLDDSEYVSEPYLFVGLAVTSRKVTGPGLPAAGLNWTYAYGTPNHCWNPASADSGAICTVASPTTRTTTLTDPDGVVTRYSFGNRYRVNEGLLLKTEYGWDGNAALRTASIAYADPETGPYAAFNGNSRRHVGDYDITSFRRPRQQVATVQQGATFTWQANSFDSFARALSATRSSTLGYSRTDTTVYHDHMTKWVLGQPVSSTNTDTGLVESQTDYDANALPWKIYAFGKLQQTLAYNGDGTLSSVTDGNNHTTVFEKWKHGIPQSITFADNTVKSAAVNDLGWITSATDENGYTTKYGYDVMGRINLIDYPDNGAADWNNTTISFQPWAQGGYGIAGGHWRRVAITGNAYNVTFYDALWRPVITETYDAADLPNTLTQTVTRYDAQGRATFASYPQRNQNAAVSATWGNPDAWPEALGTWTTYDALGRPTQVQQNSELGALTTVTTYLPDFQTQTQDPKGNLTTRSYYAYDQPSAGQLRGIAHPEGAYTTVYRDVFGKPTALVRSNADNSQWNARYYAYDLHQRLCKQSEVETGTTAFGYDDAGNLAWSAAGLPWSAEPPCEYTADHASVTPRRVDRTYDARDRLKTLVFPDGQGNQALTYQPDGKLATISAANGGGDLVTTTYAYNNRRLPVSERMTWGAVDWTLFYGYNANGHMDWHSQPNGVSLGYAPNALGQPTQAGPYATGVKYYPNGAMQQFTYGNGIVHTMTQNARQLPEQSLDNGVLNDSYAYDANGNVAAITDGANAGQGNRTMTYDGLDRLKTAVSPMFGNASYSYDALDNMTHLAIGGPAARDHHYCFDAANRLTNVKTGSCAGASVMGLGYDERGNLANRNGDTFVFDYGNRLRTASPGTSRYVYDGHGRRVGDIVKATPKISLYSQSGQLAYARNLREGGLSTNYLHLNGSLVAMREQPLIGDGGGVVKYIHTDSLGSPVAVTDQNKTILEKSEYEPYGRLINRPLKDGPDYTGHVLDAATELLYAQQRYFMTDVPVSASVDPMPVDTSTGWNFNRYNYAANNPYTNIDPDGRATCANKDCSKSTVDSSVQPPAPHIKGGQYGASGTSQNANYGRSENASNNAIEITFKNDNPNGASPNQPISTETAVMFETAVSNSGLDSVNVNSTTGGDHAPTSNHYLGKAVDINRVNGQRVDSSSAASAVRALQDAAAATPNIRENFGPAYNQKTRAPGSVPVPVTSQSVIRAHGNHIHLSGQE